ncbi:MAG: hypothetical protein ACHQK9_01695 [Reyranellales bacterium]
MRLLSPFIVLLGIAATGQALAAPPEDVPAAVTVLRGSSAPAEPPPPPPVVTTTREVIYVPVYTPVYTYLAVAPPLGIQRHRSQARLTPAPMLGATTPARR